MAPRQRFSDYLNRLDEEEEALSPLIKSKREEALNQLTLANQPTSFSSGDAIATSINGLLPMILGAALAGKRGLRSGAKAGQAASTNYATLTKENMKEGTLLAKARAKFNTEELDDLTKRRDKLADQSLKGEGDLAMEDVRQSNRMETIDATQDRIDARGDKKSREGPSTIPPETLADIAERTGKTVEEVQAEVNLPKSDFYKVNAYKYAEGGNVKLPGEANTDKLAAGKEFNAVVNKMEQYAAQMENDPAYVNALNAGRVTDYFKNPESPAYQFYAYAALAKKKIARMNDSGALSKIDVDMFAPFAEGSPMYNTPKSIRNTIGQLREYGNMKHEALVGSLKATGRNVTGIESQDAATKGVKPNALTDPEGFKAWYKANKGAR